MVLGKIEELGDYVYKSNGNDKADKFVQTTEAIAEYVGLYSWEMRILVKNRTEANFTKPAMPTVTGVTPRSRTEGAAETAADGGGSALIMAEYKAELENYHRDVRKYRDDKAKTFVIILGQCTEEVMSVLTNGGGLATLEQNRDVKGLLDKLEAIAMSTEGVDEEFVTLAGSFRRLASIQQGPREKVARYHKRFMISANVLKGQWGDNLFPSKLVVTASRNKDTTWLKTSF